VRTHDPGDEAGKTPASRSDKLVQLTRELHQPLAAASNYVGAARLLLRATDEESLLEAIQSLGRAEAQILRAGEIARRIATVVKGESRA
jgi:phosphoglycerate-specific signal transduction histidine kinase